VCQILWKSDNAFSSYSWKCRGCFFWDTLYCGADNDSCGGEM